MTAVPQLEPRPTLHLVADDTAPRDPGPGPESTVAPPRSPQDSLVRSGPFWKNAALLGVGTSLFVGAFVVSGDVVVAAGSVGAELAMGGLGVYGAQSLMAGVLGAVGGAALAAVKTGIKALSGAIRESRFQDTSVAAELRKADAHYRQELVHDLKHSMLVGMAAGTALATAAIALPGYVLTGLIGAVHAGRIFELGKMIINVGAFFLEAHRGAKATAAGDITAAKKHRWERDEEVEEILLNLVNLGVLGVLAHSLHDIDSSDLAGVTTGVAQSADEVVALATMPAEIAESVGVLAQQASDMRAAPSWFQRVRRIFTDPNA